MAYDKPFLSYDKQIDLLIQRGLLIFNRDFATRALSTLSYYDLINRYKNHFMTADDVFHPNITIEYLYDFFLFDKEIQSFILKYSVLIESIFKTKFSYILSHNIGVDTSQYLKPYYYDQAIVNSNLTFKDVQLEIFKWLNGNTVKNPTKYYLENHNHVPSWILFKNLSLGNTINLFKFFSHPSKHDLVDSIVTTQNISFPDKVSFISCAIDAIREFRNCAAHSLNFTELRINSRRRPAPSILYKLTGTPFLTKKDKKVLSFDKKSTLGIYGCMLSMFILLGDPYLQSKFISDFLTLLSPSNLSNVELYNTYAEITDMPLDIYQRFLTYYKNINR